MTLRQKIMMIYVTLALTVLAISGVVIIHLQPTLNASAAHRAACRLTLHMTPQEVAQILGNHPCRVYDCGDYRDEDWSVTYTHIVKVIYTKDRSGTYRARDIWSGPWDILWEVTDFIPKDD